MSLQFNIPVDNIAEPVKSALKFITRLFEQLYQHILRVEPVIPVTFENAWVDFGGALEECGYYKDLLSRVYLVGQAKNGVVGSAMFTLPVGYRPAATLSFICMSNGAVGVLTVDSAGVVIPAVGSNVSFSISGISFRIA